MELSEQPAATDEQAVAAAQPMKRVRNAIDFMFGAQQAVLEELILVGNEMLDRARTETHLMTEFVSKMAGAHSVRDVRSMLEECGQHQIDFIRRDNERLFKHGARVIETTSRLFSRPN